VPPDPNGGAYSAPQTTIAGLRGPTSKRERREKRKGRGQGRKGREQKEPPPCKFLDLPLVEADSEPMTNFPCGTKSSLLNLFCHRTS